MNLYRMVLMIAIMKNLSVFLNNSHFGCFIMTIMKDFQLSYIMVIMVALW